MSAASLRQKKLRATAPAPSLTSSLVSSLALSSPASLSSVARKDDRLAALASLASVDIETPLVANLSGELHALFDPVSDDVLPIYFGPLLGRLYLEGL